MINKKIIFVLFVLFFNSCELRLPEEPATPAWYLPLSVPLIDQKYSFEGILQEGVIETSAEPFVDCGEDINGVVICEGEPGWNSNYGNGFYDVGLETFTDENGNNQWDSFDNMIQMEFANKLDTIGLGVVEEQLGISFFKLDLSDISIDPQIIQSETEYDLGENLPDPLMPPVSVEIPIDIPNTGNSLVDLILDSCEDFVPSNNQTFSFDVGDLSALPNPIEEANNAINSNSALLDPIEVPLDVPTDGITLGDLGDISVVKIILDENMLWEVTFTNGLPFIIESLVFNIFKGPVADNEKLTSMIISNIQPYQTVVENVNFESYELTLDVSLFAKIEINLDSDQSPPNDCPLNICVADGVTFDDSFNPTINQDDFNIYDTQIGCESACDPCIGQDIHACTTDALVNGSVDTNAIETYDSSLDCSAACDPCYVESIYACLASGINSSGNIDQNSVQTYTTEDSCESGCNPCVSQNIFVCPLNPTVPFTSDSDCLATCGGGLVSCISSDIFTCVPSSAADPTWNPQTYNTDAECQAACTDYCLDATTAVCVASALGDDLSVTGDPATYQGEGAQAQCEAVCDPCIDASTYVCSTEDAVINGGSPTTYQGGGAQAQCEAACNPCLLESLNGWETQQNIPLSFELNGELILNTLVLNLTMNETPDTEPIQVEFPSFDQIEVREAVIDDGTYFDDYGSDGIINTSDQGEGDETVNFNEKEYLNRFDLNVDNGFFGQANLEISFNNVYNQNETIYSENITIESEANYEGSFNLSDKIIGDKDSGENLENIEISYDFSIENGEYSIPLTDNKLTIGETGYSAEVSNMKLESISAITQNLDFPQYESFPIQDIPNGFDDFKLYDVFLDMNIYNQITINTVKASFNLEGKKCPQGMTTEACFLNNNIDKVTFPFNINLDSPNRRLDNPCGYEVGDIAVTKISINKDAQITSYYCNEEDDSPYQILECYFESNQNVAECDFGDNPDNLLNFIYFGPNQMVMDGGVLIDGEGTLRENDELWGDFSIIAPMAFVFYEDWTFIPQDLTPIAPLDESVSNQIQESLVEAAFNAEITNNSPFGLSVSMLISDSNIFPLYIDNLDNLDERCLNDLYDNEVSCIENDFSWVNYTDSLANLGISSISYNIDDTDGRFSYVEFYDENQYRVFWIGRIIDVAFIPPNEVDENGFVISPSIYVPEPEILDATTVSWFTAAELRYMAPMITLASTGGNPSSLQTTNYLGVRSFLTFVLDTDGLSKNNGEKKVNNIKNKKYTK